MPMSKIYSAEFDDTEGDRVQLLGCCAELLAAGRQFSVTPRFDTTPAGPVVKSGFILTWPEQVRPEAPRDEKASA